MDAVPDDVEPLGLHAVVVVAAGREAAGGGLPAAAMTLEISCLPMR